MVNGVFVVASNSDRCQTMYRHVGFSFVPSFLWPMKRTSRIVEGSGGVQDCTIAVMSYVADMSSDVMWNTQPIISCILSNNTQLKTGN